jgi:general secretion pathway protein L
VRDSAVVRLLGDQLYWYPPGRGVEPIPLDDLEQQNQLLDVLKARRSPVIFAVPGADVRLQEVRFSASEKRHISKSLPFLLEEEFVSDIEDMHIASMPLDDEVLAVASSSRDRIEQWQRDLEKLPGIKQWVPESLLLPWRSGEITLVIEGGQAVVRLGDCEGFSVEADMLPALLLSVATERLDSVILYGLDQAADTELVPAAMHDKVQWRNGGYSAALLLGDDASKPLNLLQGEYGPRLPLDQWWRTWRFPIAALGLAFLVQLFATYADFLQLESVNLNMRQSMEAAYRQAVPKGAIADPERQLQRKLKELRGDQVSVAFVPLLQQVGKVVQAEKNAYISTVNFSGRSGELRMNLLVPDFKAVERIRSQLNSDGLSATVESSNAQDDAVRARMKIKGAAS